jgi:hypothetical protein
MTEKLEMIENNQVQEPVVADDSKDGNSASCLLRCFPGEKRGTLGRVPQPIN